MRASRRCHVERQESAVMAPPPADRPSRKGVPMIRPLLAIAAFVTLLSPAALAQGGDRPHHAPPPAAFDACKGKKAADACEVTFGERTMAGKCAATPDGQLACRPEPPPEMKKACEGKKEGDACSVQKG